MKVFLSGAIFTLILLLVGGYAFISLGLMPANADGKPPVLEKWMARKSLRATLQKEAPQGPVPVQLTDANLKEGIQLYAQNCAVCHGASDGQASNIAVGLYQHAPQLAQHGVEDDPEGKIFWFVKHGVRLTGMPAFSPTLSDEKIWKVTLFLKHMDALPPTAQKAWKAVKSAKAR
jgi:mono/diheme cytochrome c family protein